MKKQHIIYTFLNKLPEPIRTQAINNAGDNINKTFVGRTIKDAIFSAFILDETPEGANFWKSYIDEHLL